MARLPRLSIPGHPHLLIQSTSAGRTAFAEAEDYTRLLSMLQESAAHEGASLHAYTLLPDQVQLLLTPHGEGALPRIMQAIGRRYVQTFNRRQRRSGALWEGRYRATVLQAETWLLRCMVSLDLAPVRAGHAIRPADYAWSSHGHYAGLRHERLLTPHPLMWDLGNTPFAREAAYVERVRLGLADDEQAGLADAARKGWALGEPEFIARLQEGTARRLSRGRAGRPPAAGISSPSE